MQRKAVLILIISLLALISGTVNAVEYQTIGRISVPVAPATDTNGGSGNSAITPDGRYVVFSSSDWVLVPNQDDVLIDIFIRDTVLNTTAQLSLTPAGGQPNNHSFAPSISDDGRYVAFASSANDLVANDNNNAIDVFVRDLQTNTTTRVSVNNVGIEGNALSSAPEISANGRYVAFISNADNLVPNDNNGKRDVFVRDLELNTTTRVSVDSLGNEAIGADSDEPLSISATGQYITFVSFANNLVTGDTGNRDVFVRDIVNNTTVRASVGNGGEQGNRNSDDGEISADGRYVAFTSASYNLVPADANLDIEDIFVRDLVANTTTLVSLNSAGQAGNEASFEPVITADGRYVVFNSFASNLVSKDTNNVRDSFVRDTLTNTTIRITVDTIGREGIGENYYPTITDNGEWISFTSNSPFVPEDANGSSDVYIMRFVPNLLVNGGFEDDQDATANQPDNWTAKALSKDQRRCNTPTTTVAYRGVCAYQFTGTAAEKVTLTQSVNSTGVGAGDRLSLRLYYKTNTAAPRLRVKLLVYYNGVTSPNIVSGTITTRSTAGFKRFKLADYTVRNKVISKVKVQFQNTATSGRITIDAAALILVPVVQQSVTGQWPELPGQ